MYNALIAAVLRRPRAVVVAWLAIGLAGGVLATRGLGNITETGYSVPGSQSARLEGVLRNSLPHGSGAWIVAALSTASAPAIAQASTPLQRLHDVAFVETLATEGQMALVAIRLTTPYAAAENRVPEIEHTLQKALGRNASSVLLGEVAVSRRYSTILRQDLTKAEEIALPITFAALIVAFLSFVAAALPVALAALALTITLASIELVSLCFGLSAFTLDTSSAVALGLSVDYALIVVTRYREARTTERSVERAVVRTMQTAGRAVVLSGLTIAASLLALLAVGVGLFSSIAVGGILATLTAVLLATTALPAAICLLGDRLDRFTLSRVAGAAHRGTVWRGLARVTTSHPIVAALASVAVLLALAIPALSLRLDFRNVSALPSHDPITLGLIKVSAAFGAGASGPVEIVTHEPERIEPILASDPAVQRIWRVVKGRDSWYAVYVILNVAPDTDAAHAAVTRFRQQLGSGADRPLVGGVTASEMDLTRRVASRMPLVIGIAILIGFAALALGLKSIVIPLKAVLCGVLSVSATLGIVLLCFPSAGGGARIAFFVPLLIFVLVLGLSIDYEVFLLSRVREMVRGGYSNERSVAIALTRTGRPIALAGFTIATVFTVFCFSSLEAVRQLGVGVAAGIVLDVSIVRCVLVPACVVLLGRWNWWFPTWRSRAQVANPPASDV
jgi:uncharacterized membrane protein YdfJ with MMPL/SSD domain